MESSPTLSKNDINSEANDTKGEIIKNKISPTVSENIRTKKAAMKSHEKFSLKSIIQKVIPKSMLMIQKVILKSLQLLMIQKVKLKQLRLLMIQKVR